MIGKPRLISLLMRGISNYILKRPLCISFEITHSCNARCKHCHRGGQVKEERATPQEFGEISRKLKPVVAQVSGGEPLLRNDLKEIIEALKISNKPPFIIITTNGALLTKKKYLELRKAGVDEFSISLDYPDERHDEFRHIPGLFEHIKTLIESLESENNKGITLCCVIQRDNFKELTKMVELARRWNVKINFSAYTWLRTENKNYMIPNEELPEFKEIIKKLLEFRKNHIYASRYAFNKMFNFFKNNLSPRCRTGERFFNVNPDGTISPCGLIIKSYKTQKELRECFAKNNDCRYCYTSIRANSEKPLWHLIKDNIRPF